MTFNEESSIINEMIRKKSRAKYKQSRRNISFRLARRKGASLPTPIIEPFILVSRMFLYVWENLNMPGDVKVGEHYNEHASIINAINDTKKYIRESQGRYKKDFDENKIVIHAIIDVTEAAKNVGKFYKNAKMDDYVRRAAALPGRVSSKSEFHRITNIDNFIGQIRSFLDRLGQPRSLVTLSLAQIYQAHATICAFQSEKRVLVAELAPRFGKTIYSMVVARELNVPLTVYTSYVLTSFTSVINDINRFAQFANMVLVDTTEEGWEQQVKHALDSNKQVVACVSLCKGAYRESRLQFLAKQRTPRLWIVDEADYGAHRPQQASTLQTNVKNDRVILMTGSAGDRAVSSWKIDEYLSVTYPELLMNKRQKLPSDIPTLQHFRYDSARNQSYPNLVYLQLGFGSFVDHILKYCPEVSITDLPSMTKMIAAPQLMKGFIITLFQALFDGKRIPQLSIERFIDRNHSSPTVAMVFVSAATKTKNLNVFANIVKTAINWDVYVLSGENTTGRNAEDDVSAAIATAKDKNKNLLIIAAQMGQRSFSIPELTEVYLMYDGGDAAPTMQKASRCLTPSGNKKTGYVISVSFDPNRDDKFDALIDQTATNIAKNMSISYTAALKQVFDTVEFWEASNGTQKPVPIDPKRYIEQLQSINRAGRVWSRTMINDLTHAEYVALLASTLKDSNNISRQPVSIKGTTYMPQAKNLGAASTPRIASTMTERKKVAEALAALINHAPYFYRGLGATSVEEMLHIIEHDPEVQSNIESDTDMHWTVVYSVLSRSPIVKRLDCQMTYGR